MARAREFLGSRRVALVGFSRNPKDFSRTLDAALRKRGIEVVPVHPSATELDGRRCFPRVSDIHPPVEGALIVIPPTGSEEVVRDCLDAGVRRIWLHRGGGPGSKSSGAFAACAERGIEPVTDLCPFMVMPGAGWPHRLHGWMRRRSL
jgi:predicted CoA-binding protein